MARRRRWVPLAALVLAALCAGAAGQAAHAQALRLSDEVRAMRTALAAPSASAPSLAGDPVRRPAAEAYEVVALRVEFQPDTTRFTTGPGIFDAALFDTLEATIDPLPHDAAYFQAHLDFLADYVERVSDGQTQVRTHLLPGIVRVSQPMGAYSPTGPDADSDAELAKQAALVEEAWTLADRQLDVDLSAFDPATTVFVLFHAGVGRDFELVGTTLDKTPEDLPSLYFAEPTLRRLLGGVLPSVNGRFVTHSLILPRTDSRVGFDFINDEEFLLELSINGLLVNSFFNHLGVPDLFNTAEGTSAIGQFGLMDPEGFFAYQGLFPPEPSAWTKYYLGWVEPIEVTQRSPNNVTLRAVSAVGSSDVARASISGSEYFLIENRYRDPEGDGLRLRIYRDGEIVTQEVQNGDEGFSDFDVSSFIGGTVVGVDNYDWALPGGLDEDGGTLNGGILIWHIDERQIRDGLADNTVNADPERRGVDVEEADGAQDIGFPSGNPFGPDFSGGTPFDFWFAGNPASVITGTGETIQLYANRFGPDTYPPSTTQAGASSFIVLDAFSDPAAEMGVTFLWDEARITGVTPLFSAALGHVPAGRAVLAAVDGPTPLLLVTDLVSSRLTVLDARTGAEVTVVDSVRTRPSVQGDRAVALQTFDGAVRVLTFDAATGDFTSSAAGVQAEDLDPALVRVRDGARPAWVARDRADGSVVRIGQQIGGGFAAEVDRAAEAQAIAWGGTPESYVRLTASELVLTSPSATQSWTLPQPIADAGQIAVGRDDHLRLAVPAVGRRQLILVTDDGRAQITTVDLSAFDAVLGGPAVGTLHPLPVLADLNADGRLDVLAIYRQHVLGFTFEGGLLEGYPIALSEAVPAQPLVLSPAEMGAPWILAASASGAVRALRAAPDETLAPGFPLPSGAGTAATPLLYDGVLYTLSEQGAVRAWAMPENVQAVWPGLFGGTRNGSYVELAESATPVLPEALLDPDETFNWPNPVRDGQTFFHLRPREDGSVRITVLDPAGQLVDEVRADDVRAGVATDIPWRTDAQSGLYYARVTFEAESGEEATEIIKVVVVR